MASLSRLWTSGTAADEAGMWLPATWPTWLPTPWYGEWVWPAAAAAAAALWCMAAAAAAAAAAPWFRCAAAAAAAGDTDTEWCACEPSPERCAACGSYMEPATSMPP